MQPVQALFHMYPDANYSNTEVIADENGNWEITKWDLPVAKPEKADIENYWNAHEQEIIEANKPQPSELELMKKSLTDLSYQLMMGGVI